MIHYLLLGRPAPAPPPPPPFWELKQSIPSSYGYHSGLWCFSLLRPRSQRDPPNRRLNSSSFRSAVAETEARMVWTGLGISEIRTESLPLLLLRTFWTAHLKTP